MDDTGEGIAPEVQARIFEPFLTTKELGRGAGLGWATAYGIVEESQGVIHVESELGEGTRFLVFLPETSQTRASSPSLTLNKDMTGTETILLVEDDEAVRALLVRQLEELGYRVLDAANGEAALALDDQVDGHIDVLLSDIVMPGMRGPELARALKARHPQLAVLLMSGYADLRVAAGELPDVAVEYLQKPIGRGVLAGALRQALVGSESLSEGSS